MNQAEERTLKVDHVMRTLHSLIVAEIAWQYSSDDAEGTDLEQRNLREALVDLLGLPEGT